MTTFKRGKKWNYDFEMGGRRYRGICENCESREEAKEFEKRIRRTASELKAQRSVKALVENFRDVLSGGRRISLGEAFGLAAEKPVARKAAGAWEGHKRRCWEDFVAFMGGAHPDVRFLSDVTRSHCEEYVSHLRLFGRCATEVKSRNGARPYSKGMSRLSAKTCNTTQTVVARVFALLLEDAGLSRNPFSGIPKMKSNAVSRDVFQPEEIGVILSAGDSFCRDVLMASLYTGLREGDVCNLRWEDIDLAQGFIRVVQRKTKRAVSIPIMGRLDEFLRASEQKTGFVFPAQRALYLHNSSGFSARIHTFLESLGISTRVMAEGRCRKSSIKDFHSCRHTFCWLAGQAGIPLPTVQSIVGHMTPEMTAHYSAHVTEAQKREQIRRMETGVLAPGGNARQSLHDLVERLPPEKMEEARHILQGLLI